MQKVLGRLSPREHKLLTEIIKHILNNDLAGLDLKKLQGRDDVYRVRKGNFRIIFRRNSHDAPMIIAIERRSETTYKEFN